MTGNANIEIKHVIVPVDFSNSSKNAVEHAVSIAKKFRADLTLLCVMDPFTSQALNCKGAKFSDFKEKAAEALNQLTRQIFTFNKIEIFVAEGRWVRAVTEMADRIPASMMVLGVGGKNRDGFFDGPHAYRIVDAISIPLLVVKEDQKAKEYKIITTPLDQTFHTREKLPFVTLMASAFDAKVSVIGLQTNTDKETSSHMQAIMRQASQYVQMKVRQYQDRLIASKNEVGDLVKHANEDQADLLVIMSSHEKTFSTMFSSPYAQQVLDKSNTPILICPIRVSLVMNSVSI